MILIYIFMALAIVALALGSALAGFLIHLVLRRFIRQRRLSLFIAVLSGWVLNALLFWNPWPLYESTAWLLGLGLLLALAITLPFVRSAEK